MRIFKSKWFSKYARKEKITDAQLKDAVENIQKGLVDCDYQDGVIKQRIARKGQGKSGGYRSIILYRSQACSFFVFCYSKNKKTDLNEKELEGFKILSKEYLSLKEEQIKELLLLKELIEVK